ncbi:hypothetical protein G7077_07510 [Sphingomonas piscis]|uniref:Uncharacterized protein n=1 Tax=Sphingomonas piscis TaxID=2714943 RepID=A0A6G7YPU6_9SPHN|nr:hypothetical protein [Sphingomonas piscis]QIK78765.1 hypothetical protein G7077_07510 [Sphingomonas piscis]
MPRRVKDYIEISEFTSLDKLIAYLQTIRDTLPPEAEPEMKVRGDEVFGRRLTISYFRELTPEEEECEARYSPAALPADDDKIDELTRKLDQIG